MTTIEILIFVATVFNGLLAGVFFNWTNAITPGIGSLPDKGYLSSFQAMNRSILNPIFYVVFFGAAVFSLGAILLAQYGTLGFWMLLSVMVIYVLGVIIITLVGNIPLNNRLDILNVDDIPINEAARFRDSYEQRWNRFHLFRTICSVITFVMLIYLCIIY